MKLNRQAIEKVAKGKGLTIDASLNDLEALNSLTNSGKALTKAELVSIGLSSGDTWDSIFTVDSFTPNTFEVSQREGKNGKFEVFKAIDKDGKVLSLKESQYFQMVELGQKAQYFHLVSISEGRYNKEESTWIPYISFKFDISTSASSQKLKYNKEAKGFTQSEIETIKGQKSFNAGIEYLKRKGIPIPQLVELGLMEEGTISATPRFAGEKLAEYKARTGNKAIKATEFNALPVA